MTVSQQTTEPSYPENLLIAINKRGVSLIDPKNKEVSQQGVCGRSSRSVVCGVTERARHLLSDSSYDLNRPWAGGCLLEEHEGASHKIFSKPLVRLGE